LTHCDEPEEGSNGRWIDRFVGDLERGRGPVRKRIMERISVGDGTVLRIKPIVIGISRVPEAQTADGDPVYNMRSTLVTDIRPARG
jgi:hypothetical protein